jgi:hypothetical protein
MPSDAARRAAKAVVMNQKFATYPTSPLQLSSALQLSNAEDMSDYIPYPRPAPTPPDSVWVTGFAFAASAFIIGLMFAWLVILPIIGLSWLAAWIFNL